MTSSVDEKHSNLQEVFEEDRKKILLKAAQNFVWWKTPEETLLNLHGLLCRALRYGTWEDIQELEKTVGRSELCEALIHAPPGILDEASWNYWHYRFGILPVPSLPRRQL